MKNRGEPFKAFKGFAGMLGLAFLAYTCSKEYKANNLRSTTEAETDENTVTDPDSEGGSEQGGTQQGGEGGLEP